MSAAQTWLRAQSCRIAQEIRDKSCGQARVLLVLGFGSKRGDPHQTHQPLHALASSRSPLGARASPSSGASRNGQAVNSSSIRRISATLLSLAGACALPGRRPDRATPTSAHCRRTDRRHCRAPLWHPRRSVFTLGKKSARL